MEVWEEMKKESWLLESHQISQPPSFLKKIITKNQTHHSNFIAGKLANVLDHQTAIRLRLNELVALLLYGALDQLAVQSLLVKLLIQLEGGGGPSEGRTGGDGDVVVLITTDVQHGIAGVGELALDQADAWGEETKYFKVTRFEGSWRRFNQQISLPISLRKPSKFSLVASLKRPRKLSWNVLLLLLTSSGDNVEVVVEDDVFCCVLAVAIFLLFTAQVFFQQKEFVGHSESIG